MPAATRLGRAARDGAIAAAAGAVLALPMIGIRMNDQSGGETLSTRWPDLALTVLIAGVLGFVFSYLAGRWRRPRFGTPNPVLRVLRLASRRLPWALAALALILPFLPFVDRRGLDILILILIYVVLGWGLNIVTGLAGLLDLGYAAFAAIGAYTTAILGLRYGFSWWESLPLSALFAALAGIVLGFPMLRLRGDYFAIVTLGFGEIIRILANNWRALTQGAAGIAGAPRPSFFGIADFTANPAAGQRSFTGLFGIAYNPVHRVIFLYYLILALALAVNLFTLRIRRLPIGRAWEALREDDIACQALGIDRRLVKLSAFGIGAAWGGIGGALIVARQGFVSPENFGFGESVVVTAIVVLGGLGSQLGIVLAAAMMIGLTEWFRWLAEYRMLVFGLSMIAIMRFRPSGLIAIRRPSVRLPSVTLG